MQQTNTHSDKIPGHTHVTSCNRFKLKSNKNSQQHGNVQLHNSISTCDIQIAWQWEPQTTCQNKQNEKFWAAQVLETAARHL